MPSSSFASFGCQIIVDNEFENLAAGVQAQWGWRLAPGLSAHCEAWLFDTDWKLLEVEWSSRTKLAALSQRLLASWCRKDAPVVSGAYVL